MPFEQATIKVENEPVFGPLRGAVEQAFRPEKVKEFLKRLDRKRIAVRDFSAVLAQKVLEQVAGSQIGSAKQLYESLPVSDQALLRELYLSKLEGVDQVLRHRFKKVYQYY